MKRSRLVIRSGAAGLACALAFWGCGGAQEEVAEKMMESSLSTNGADVDVSLDRDSENMNLSATTEEGTMNMSIGENSAVPEDWPEDIPIYEGTNVMVANSMAEQNSFMIQGTIAAPVAKVSEYYKKEAPGKGWEQQQAFSQATGMESIVYQKGDRILNVTLIAEGENTSISLATSKQ